MLYGIVNYECELCAYMVIDYINVAIMMVNCVVIYYT